jgi:hypothetical protein
MSAEEKVAEYNQKWRSILNSIEISSWLGTIILLCVWVFLVPMAEKLDWAGVACGSWCGLGLAFSFVSAIIKSNYGIESKPIEPKPKRPERIARDSSETESNSPGLIGLTARVVLLPIAIIGGILWLANTDHKKGGPP